MGLFTRLRNWLQRQQPATRSTPPAAVTPAPVPPTARRPSQPTRPTPPPLPPITGTPDPRVRVTVQFRAVDHPVDLRPPLTLRGRSGTPLTLTPPTLPGFELAEVVGFSDRFPAANQTITCLYRPRVAAPVVIYHRDTHGRLLAPPTVLAGKLHAPFAAAPLPELAAHLTRAAASGRFTEASQTRTLTYALDPLVPVQAPEAAYIELLMRKACYAQPDLQAPLATQLPAGTYWRVFGLARDQDGTVWLNIGGSQWLTATDTRPQRSDPFQLPPAPQRLPLATFAYTLTPAAHAAIITGGGRGISQWHAPYGSVLPEVLTPGTRVAVTHTATATNGSQWARLSTGAYVQADYLQAI